MSSNKNSCEVAQRSRAQSASAVPAPIEFIEVDWPAPKQVRSFCSSRIGGVSEAPFAGLNLSADTGDAAQRVAINNNLLYEQAQLPHPARWPRQVHGVDAIDATKVSADSRADAVFSDKRNTLCSVRSADCLPVLFCDQRATIVAAAHAGWRGLAAGVLESTLAAMPCPAQETLAWLGPAIGPTAYEVGTQVRDAFIAHSPFASEAFSPSPLRSQQAATQHWMADLYELARQRLRAAGVTHIYGGELCTFSDSARFFSYRRDGVTGRMACGVWLAAD